MQAGASHDRTGYQYWVEIGHRCDRPRTPYLIAYMLQTSTYSLGLILIGNSPTWAFGRKTKQVLLSRSIYLEDNTISSYGQCQALGIETIDKGIYILPTTAQCDGIRDFETPLTRLHQSVVMILCQRLITI